MSSIHHLSRVVDDILEFRVFQPSDKDRQTPRRLPFKEGQIVDYVEQEHVAKRAGRHTDLRIGTRRGMYSWATKKEIPEPGKKIQLHPQPVHPHHYNDFEGDIPSGYGAGTVRTKHLGKALVTRAGDQTNISVLTKRGMHRLGLISHKLGHLLVREKHPEIEAQKPKMKSIPHEGAEDAVFKMPIGTLIQPKVDGALVYVGLKGNRPEIFSHRKSKSTGRQIIHTERVFHGRPRTNLAPEHRKTLLGELYGERRGRAIPPQELGGLLNTHIAESIRRQRAQRIKLKVMPFDIAGDKSPYTERLARIKEIAKQLPRGKFTLPETTDNPSKSVRLIKRIKSGRHPLTKEGVIVRPPSGTAIKVKSTEEEDVRIHSTFPGKGKYAKSHGGFIYSDREGRPLGRVGTGFTDQTRAELHKYVDRIARVRHQGKFKSGRLRAPSFIAAHESRD